MSITYQVKNIHKFFGSKVVLNGVNFNVTSGESVAILGGSGSGKTVLFKILSTLIQPDIGDIIFEGNDIAGIKVGSIEQESLMEKFGFAFQLNTLFDSYNIWQNVCFRALNNSSEPKELIKKRAIKYLEMVGLEERVANLMPSEISGGMQKRVAVARAMIGNPKVMFFDEPTSGLDPLTSRKIAALIRDCDSSFETKATKFSIVHDLEVAKIVADKILFLHQGKIEWSGKPDEMHSTTSKAFKEFIEATPT